MAGKNAKRRYLAIGKESTYGDGGGTALPDDIIYAEDIVFEFDSTPIPRLADSPRRPGFGNVDGVDQIKLGFMTELYFLDTSAGGGTEVCHNDTVFDSCFEDITGTTTRSRKLADYAFNSVGADLYEEDITGGQGTTYNISGLRGNIKIDMPMNDRVKILCDWMGDSVTYADYSGGVPVIDYQDSKGDYRLPVVNKGATLTMSTDAASSVSYAGDFFSGEIDTAMEPDIVEAASAASGITEITLNPQGAAKGKIVIAQTAIASLFDPRTYKNSSTNLLFNVAWTDPNGSGDTVTLVFYAQITSVKNIYVGKRAAWECSLDLVYPETGTSHNSGQTPMSVLDIQWA